MASISLGDHFESFVEMQIEEGRFRNASEVVRAGLRLLEEHELGVHERLKMLRGKIDQAWSDTRPSLPAKSVFARLEALHRKETKKPKPKRA